MSNHDPPNHPSSSSSSSSVTDTLMNYLTAAMTKSQDAFEHAKNFGRKASEQLSYTAAQAQVQAQRATNYVSGRSSSNDNDLFGSEYGHATANRQTNRDDLSGSSDNYNNGGNYNSSREQTNYHGQEIGSADPTEKRRWSRGTGISYSSHHYAAAHSSFKLSQGGL